MTNILAASAQRMTPQSPAALDADWSGDIARWGLVERRLLMPARKSLLACIVRLERADGAPLHWLPGDRVELCGPASPAGFPLEGAMPFLRGPRHGAVSLLPGGWPVGDDWLGAGDEKLRLPIASAADSGTLDLLVLAGGTAGLSLDSDACRSLLSGTEMDLRLLRRPDYRPGDAPLLFIGDLESAAIARAFLQARGSDNLLFLIEAAGEEASVLSEGVFLPQCLRDGTIRTMPALADPAILNSILEEQRRTTGALLGAGGHIVVAGVSSDFIAAATGSLRGFFGNEETAALERAGRFKMMAI